MIEIARRHKITILAGLFEKVEKEEHVYKAFICVDSSGLVAKYHKLHPFINPHITPGSSYCVFDLHGWKCGILICYDNNVIENVRATVLLGAQVNFFLFTSSNLILCFFFYFLRFPFFKNYARFIFTNVRLHQ